MPEALSKIKGRRDARDRVFHDLGSRPRGSGLARLAAVEADGFGGVPLRDRLRASRSAMARDMERSTTAVPALKAALVDAMDRPDLGHLVFGQQA
jgi:hypothetical protein